MRMLPICFAAIAAMSVTPQGAYADTTLSVLYAFPANFKELQEKLAADFHQLHPDITIDFLSPADTYDNATAQVLRLSLVGQQPDVYFNGLNQVRVLVDQGKVVPLDEFATGADDFATLGYIPSMATVGILNGKTYGLPFAISTPVVYVNEDLVEKAGGSMDQFPDNWPDLLELAAKISNPADGSIGFLYGFDTAGNWLLQALITSDGGTMGSPNGCKLNFDDAHGAWALQQLEAFAKAGMPDMGWKQGREAFAAGQLGIFVESTSAVALLEKSAAGKFRMRTMPYPIHVAGGHLPAGGNVAMILSTDLEKQKAAWEYVKYVTGPIGQTAMANYTGYAPSNQKALDDPELLKDYYEQRPNFATGISQLPLMIGWYNWAGPNSVKIVDVIQNYINDLITSRRSAADTMPLMVKAVQDLLPTSCP